MLRMNNEGFRFIVLAGIAPIPLQLATVVAGASGYPLGWYILAILPRVLRYFGIAWLVWRSWRLCFSDVAPIQMESGGNLISAIVLYMAWAHVSIQLAV